MNNPYNLPDHPVHGSVVAIYYDSMRTPVNNCSGIQFADGTFDVWNCGKYGTYSWGYTKFKDRGWFLYGIAWEAIVEPPKSLVCTNETCPMVPGGYINHSPDCPDINPKPKHLQSSNSW